MATYYSNTSIIYRLRADVTESNVNQTNNSSTVNVALYLNANGSNAYSASKPGGNDFYIDINGTRVAAKRVGFSIVGGQTVHVLSGSRSITHNADGSKSVSIGFGMTQVGSLGSYDPGSISGSATFGLTKINRLSTATLDKTRYNPGDTVTVNISKSVSSYTTTIVTNWYQADTRRELISKHSGTSYSFTLPEWLYSAIPSETSGWGSLSIQTYNGDSLLGTTDSSRFDIDVPNTASYQPVINDPTITEADSSIQQTFGVFVQGKSKLRIQTSAEGKLYATISRVEVTVEGVTYIGSDITTNVINGSGSIPVTIKAIDSRGYSSTKTVNVSVTAYSSPSLALSAFRCNASGDQYDDGERLKVTTSVNYSGIVVDGVNKNSYSILLQYSSDNGSTWTNIVTLDTAQSCITGAFFSIANSYLLRATVTDKVGSSMTKTIGIGQAFRLMSFGKNGRSVAFGKSSSDLGKFEVAMPSRIQLNCYRGPWLSGKTPENSALYVADQIDDVSFVPILGAKTASGNSICAGFYGDRLDLKGYDADRTENGADCGVTFNSKETSLKMDISTIFNGTMSFDSRAQMSLFNLIHPVGSILTLKEGINPNTLYPGTTWKDYRLVLLSMVNSTYCIDAANSATSAANNQNVALYTFLGGDNQKWKMGYSPASHDNAGGGVAESGFISELTVGVPWIRTA